MSMHAVKRIFAALIVTLTVVSASLAIGSSPANAALEKCRTWYQEGDWYVRPCIQSDLYVDGYRIIRARSNLIATPDACYRFRTYIVDGNGNEQFSSGAWACNTAQTINVDVWNGAITTSQVFARFRAFNRNGDPILSIDSPKINR
jgi:hypothetical protein